MISQSCATGTLSPYIPSASKPWDRKRIQHFYQRIGFGATPDMIEDALASDPVDFINQIVDSAVVAPSLAEPEWGDWALSTYDQDQIQELAQAQIYEWISKWMDQMYSANPLRSKLALFWSNHFVTRLDDYGCPSYLYQYHKVLDQFSLGNFKEFTKQIGTNPAMLIFLNGVQNTKFQPNENYARELLELFTLGRDNGYTQEDITDVSRALTGWNGFSEACAAIDYSEFFFDEGEKTFFGRTGNWDYNDLHDILFEERGDEIAKYICGKLYENFVSNDPSEEIINELALVFKANNFELAPVVKALLISEHFFDDYVIGNKVKSPFELFLGFIKTNNLPIEQYYLPAEGYNQLNINAYFLASEIGQQLFNPVDVAGWEGNKVWVNNNTLTGRWQFSDAIAGLIVTEHISEVIGFAKQLAEGNLNDVEFIARNIVNHFIPNGLQTADAYDRATTVFKIEIPENYFEDGSWSLDWDEQIVLVQLYNLLRHIVRLPEFQLN